MKLQQYKAIADYAKSVGYTNQDSLLKDLKDWGLIDERSPIEDLAGCVNDDSYETMYNYIKNLMEN